MRLVSFTQPLHRMTESSTPPSNRDPLHGAYLERLAAQPRPREITGLCLRIAPVCLGRRAPRLQHHPLALALTQHPHDYTFDHERLLTHVDLDGIKVFILG